MTCWKPSDVSMPSSIAAVFFCASVSRRLPERHQGGQPRRAGRAWSGEVWWLPAGNTVWHSAGHDHLRRPGSGAGAAGGDLARAGWGAVAVSLGGAGLDDRRRGAAPGPVRGGGRSHGRPPAAAREAGRGSRRHDGRPGGGSGPAGAGGARGGVRAVAARPAGGAGRGPRGRPGPAAGMGGRSGEARHAGDHAAGRALGARPGHHRPARHQVSRHRTAAARRLAGAPHAAVRAGPGRPSAGRAVLRADRPGRCRRIRCRHRGAARKVLPGRRWPGRRWPGRRWPGRRWPEGAGPDRSATWRFGPEDAKSAITGTAGDFCRVAAQRLDPAQSGLRASGPHGATALGMLRTYAA